MEEIKCSVCHYVCKTKSELKDHVKLKHENGIMNINIDELQEKLVNYENVISKLENEIEKRVTECN